MTHRQARRQVGSRTVRRRGTKALKAKSGVTLKRQARPAVRVRAFIRGTN